MGNLHSQLRRFLSDDRILDTELNADGEVAWYKVELNHNNIGWVAADAVEVI